MISADLYFLNLKIKILNIIYDKLVDTLSPKQNTHPKEKEKGDQLRLEREKKKQRKSKRIQTLKGRMVN